MLTENLILQNIYIHGEQNQRMSYCGTYLELILLGCGLGENLTIRNCGFIKVLTRFETYLTNVNMIINY